MPDNPTEWLRQTIARYDAGHATLHELKQAGDAWDRANLATPTEHATPLETEYHRLQHAGYIPEDQPDDKPGHLPDPVDWDHLFTRDRQTEDWIIDELWPRGRLISITAPYKGHKSLLMLYLAASLAAGRDPWTGRQRPPTRTAYLDFEMTEDDLLERLEDMQFTPGDLHELRYFLRPDIPQLDRPEGGRLLLELLTTHNAQAVILDTFARVITSADYTGHEIREFYHWTAQHIKAAGISLARLDHTGHKNKERAIGSTAKGADVDIGWVIHPGDDGISLRHHGLTRIRWVPERIDLIITEEPLAFKRAAGHLWVAGTAEVAKDLDDLGLDLHISANAAQQALREAGRGARRQTVQHAVQYRRESREPPPGTTPEPSPPGPPPGTDPLPDDF